MERPVEEIAREKMAGLFPGDYCLFKVDAILDSKIYHIIVSTLEAERARREELRKALSLVMAQVACGNLVRSRPWAIEQVPLVTALAKATALLLRDSMTTASEETEE